jgi:thiol-disulfide isomerase/thioredoxin
MFKKLSLLGSFGLLLFSSLSAQESSGSPGLTIKDIPVYPSFDDMEYVLDYNNDTTYIVNFWATWCKPCVEELPYFEKAFRAYENKPVKFIMVSLDFKKQLESKLVPFLNARPDMPSTIVLLDQDGNTWIPKVTDEWDGAIPVTLFYKGNKRKFIGHSFESYDEISTIIDSFLR